MLAAASVVLASPAPVPVPAADTTTAPLAPTDAWVSVGNDGAAKTITPVLTTISGTPTVLSAKPTVSGTASSTEQPEATATNGAGSFPVCNNVNGDLAPFCAPSNGSTLNPGITYYSKFCGCIQTQAKGTQHISNTHSHLGPQLLLSRTQHDRHHHRQLLQRDFGRHHDTGIFVQHPRGRLVFLRVGR
jgi:hypothetical protein